MPTEFLGNPPVGCGCPGSSGCHFAWTPWPPELPPLPRSLPGCLLLWGEAASSVVWWGCCSPRGNALVPGCGAGCWPPGSVVCGQAGAGGWAPVSKPSPSHTSLRGSPRVQPLAAARPLGRKSGDAAARSACQLEVSLAPSSSSPAGLQLTKYLGLTVISPFSAVSRPGPGRCCVWAAV